MMFTFALCPFTSENPSPAIRLIKRKGKGASLSGIESQSPRPAAITTAVRLVNLRISSAVLKCELIFCVQERAETT